MALQCYIDMFPDRCVWTDGFERMGGQTVIKQASKRNIMNRVKRRSV